MRSWAPILATVLFGSMIPAVASGSNAELQATPAPSLPRPPAGKATIGGKWTQLGRPTPREAVDLERKVPGKQAKTFAKTKTDARGNYVFKAIPPGRYRLSIVIVVETAKTQGKTCSIPGFVQGLSIGGTDQTGRQVTLITADTALFTVKAGNRIAKNIAFACK